MKKIWILVLAVLLPGMLAACVYDGPPKEDTPAPAALDGVFACGESTLTFNGDGRSVSLELTDELAGRCGLPAGKSEGQYVFLLSAGGEYRRDKAEYFRILLGGESYSFRNDLGVTGETTVAFYPTADASASVRFEKR